MTTLEDFRHHWRVVPSASIRAHVGRSGHKGFVDFTAQVAVVTVGHHRVETGKIQGDHIAVQILLLCCLPGAIECALRNTRQLFHIGDVLEPVLGGIQNVVAETVGELRQLHRQIGVLLFLFLGQIDATEVEVPQGVVHGFTLCLAEFIVLVACCQLLVSLAEFSILAQLGAVLGELFQAVLVHLAQVVAVHHTVQVGNHRPGSFQPVFGCLHRLRQGFPGGFVLLRQL